MPNYSPPSVYNIKLLDYAALVKRVQGEDANKPDVVYQFSNNREFNSTDATNSGIYQK